MVPCYLRWMLRRDLEWLLVAVMSTFGAGCGDDDDGTSSDPSALCASICAEYDACGAPAGCTCEDADATDDAEACASALEPILSCVQASGCQTGALETCTTGFEGALAVCAGDTGASCDCSACGDATSSSRCGLISGSCGGLEGIPLENCCISAEAVCVGTDIVCPCTSCSSITRWACEASAASCLDDEDRTPLTGAELDACCAVREQNACGG